MQGELDHMVVRRGELRKTIATGFFHGELQEVLGHPVVEPVSDGTVNDLIELDVIGSHLDRQLLVDDLADLLR